MLKIANCKKIEMSKEEVKNIIVDYIYNEIKNNPDYKLEGYLITNVNIDVFGAAEVKLEEAVAVGDVENDW